MVAEYCFSVFHFSYLLMITYAPILGVRFTNNFLHDAPVVEHLLTI